MASPRTDPGPPRAVYLLFMPVQSTRQGAPWSLVRWSWALVVEQLQAGTRHGGVQVTTRHHTGPVQEMPWLHWP